MAQNPVENNIIGIIEDIISTIFQNDELLEDKLRRQAQDLNIVADRPLLIRENQFEYMGFPISARNENYTLLCRRALSRCNNSVNIQGFSLENYCIHLRNICNEIDRY